MHNLARMDQVEEVFAEGGAIEALVAAREQGIVRTLGISGHADPDVLIAAIERFDFDCVLLALNAADPFHLSFKEKLLPLAVEREMGIIGMKAFADGAMYSKEATWSRTPEHVVRSVGSCSVPSRLLVEYAVSTPGIHTLITGIGQIDDNPIGCQLKQNLSAAQIKAGSLSETDRLNIENLTVKIKEGKTNYFQRQVEPLSAPQACRISQKQKGGQRIVNLIWNSAYAGPEPVAAYEILRDGRTIGQVEHSPQTDRIEFNFRDNPADSSGHTYQIVTVDKKGNKASSDHLYMGSFS